MARQKRSGLRRGSGRQSSGLNNASSPSSGISTPAPMPEVPSQAWLMPRMNGSAGLSDRSEVVPSSSRPFPSPSPTPRRGRLIHPTDPARIPQVETPIESRGESPTKDSANGLTDELHADAASITSSKRKRSRSPSPDVTAKLPSSDRRLRQKVDKPIKLDVDDFYPPYKPLNKEERQSWKGWVDVESEPIYVNTMLHELGIQDVRAEEIIDLQISCFTLKPPVYGLIFLFQYQNSDHVAEGEPCPSHLWFANQLPATNACATIAMINILLNVTGVELGKPLSYFKEDTMDLTPMERAHCINEHEFIRGVHNSFASRVDMWNADQTFASRYRDQVKKHEKQLRDEERAAEAERRIAERAARENENPQQQVPSVNQPKRTPRKTKKQSKKTKTKNKKPWDCDESESPDDSAASSPEKSTYDNESAFHYVAYVPVKGHIWRLDGMSAKPQDIGTYTDPDSWLKQTVPHVQERMEAFESESGVFFNLMALVRGEAGHARDRLAANVRALLAVEEQLGAVDSSWREFADDVGAETLREADVEMGLTEAMIAAAVPEVEVQEGEERSAEVLLRKRREVAMEQESLKEEIRVQMVKEAGELAKVKKNRLDLNPMVHEVLLDLEENGEIQELMEEHRWV